MLRKTRTLIGLATVVGLLSATPAAHAGYLSDPLGIAGGNGNDTVVFKIAGGNGNDTIRLHGDDDADALHGGNNIAGGNGNDTLIKTAPGDGSI